ncbi:MAG: cytochrome b/b6 domain-containing protein [Betaproteobacteria bacterium]|nr:cytochrome b/b6 domain-containing protein [Betaproteobacteria bacterium]
MPEPATVAIRVWDLPTRIFHWTLALAVAGSVLSAKIGGDAMVWHFRLGYLVLTLLAFRIVWGLVGGRWSRFVRFAYAPATLLRYLRGRAAPQEQLDVGHSPTGALSVFALLGVLLVQLGTGLVADDEIANQGPLNRFVGSDTVMSATSWHKGWGQWLVLALVALHIAAIAFYLLKKNTNLVQPMLTGDKPLPPGTPGSADGAPQRVLALLLVALCAGLATWVSRQG